MTEYKTRNNQNPVDVSMTVYGGFEGLVQLWKDNESLVFTNDLTADESLLFQSEKSFASTGTLIEPTVKKAATLEKKEVMKGQNIIDLAVEHYGSVEGVDQILEDNKLEADHEPSAGDQVLIGDTPVNILDYNYLKKQGVNVRTTLDYPEEDNFWIGKGFFVVDENGDEILLK